MKSPSDVPHPIAQHLYKIHAQTGDSFFKLYDDWLTLAVTAFAKQEAEYMDIMRRYGPRKAPMGEKDHPADHFARALGEFMRVCQAESVLNGSSPDTLGHIYEEESITNKYSCQFFTPEPLCKMMVAMTVEPTQEPIGIADPACGSGRFFIAAMPLAPKAHFTGIDRDLTCVRMTTLNMLMRNANATIVHGNTLSLECFGGYQTARTALGGIVRPLTPENAKIALTATARAQTEQAAPVPPPTPENAPTAAPEAPPIIVNTKGQFGFDF